MKKRIGLLCAALLASLLILSGLPAGAIGRDSIGISPTTRLLQANSGQTISSTVIIINDGVDTLHYKLYAQDFKIINQDYQKSFEAASLQSDAASWIKISSEERILKPHQEAEVKYQISVPAGAALGSHHAVIFAETVPTAQGSTGVRQVKRVGSLVYIAVGGGLQQGGHVEAFNLPFFQTHKPTSGFVRISDTGNVHFIANVGMTLSNLWGRQVHSLRTQGVVIPQYDRRFNLAIDTGTPVGLYKAHVSADFLNTTKDFGNRWILVASPVWLVALIILFAVSLGALFMLTWRLIKRK